MKRFLTVVVGILLLFSNTTNAAEAGKNPLSNLPKNSIEELLKIKVSMETVLELSKDKVISEQEAKTALEKYTKQATNIAGQNITLDELRNQNKTLTVSLENQRLTVVQKIAGFINGTNIILTMASVLIAYCLSFLIPSWVRFLRKIFDLIPYEFYELLMYAGSIILMAADKWCANGMEQYLALTGALLLAGAIIVSKILHKINSNNEVTYFGILFLVWAPLAYFTANPFIGFISVAALMALLGFSVWLFPLCYCIGFKDEESVGRATTAAFIVLTIFICMKVSLVQNIGLRAFEEGALFLGSFVGYIGLLISSSKWYNRENAGRYLGAQVVTFVAGILAIFIGSTFGIGELTKIGGTFFVLWALEKTLEIMPTDREAFAYVGLFIGLLALAFGWFVKTHAALVGPFLLFI